MSAHDDATDSTDVVRYFPSMGGFMRWSYPSGYPDCGGWESVR